MKLLEFDCTLTLGFIGIFNERILCESQFAFISNWVAVTSNARGHSQLMRTKCVSLGFSHLDLKE